MIGCIEDARLIGEWDHNYPLPEGWGYLDEGEERAAFLSPDGVVYKVELNNCGINRTEYFNICKLEMQESIENWRIPEAMLYELDKFHSVIAMEYIDGEDPEACDSFLTKSCECTCEQFPCLGIEWEMVSMLWGLIDFTTENVRQLPDGTKVLIDLTR